MSSPSSISSSEQVDTSGSLPGLMSSPSSTSSSEQDDTSNISRRLISSLSNTLSSEQDDASDSFPGLIHITGSAPLLETDDQKNTSLDEREKQEEEKEEKIDELFQFKSFLETIENEAVISCINETIEAHKEKSKKTPKKDRRAANQYKTCHSEEIMEAGHEYESNGSEFNNQLNFDYKSSLGVLLGEIITALRQLAALEQSNNSISDEHSGGTKNVDSKLMSYSLNDNEANENHRDKNLKGRRVTDLARKLKDTLNDPYRKKIRTYQKQEIIKQACGNVVTHNREKLTNTESINQVIKQLKEMANTILGIDI